MQSGPQATRATIRGRRLLQTFISENLATNLKVAGLHSSLKPRLKTVGVMSDTPTYTGKLTVVG